MDIFVIEGVMGFFDGFGIDCDNLSIFFIVKCMKMFVILVVDGKVIFIFVVVIVDGFNCFDLELIIVGVIINCVVLENYFLLIKGVIECYMDVFVLGYLLKNVVVVFLECYFGLVLKEEMMELEMKWELFGDLIVEYVDLDRLLVISKIGVKLIVYLLEI